MRRQFGKTIVEIARQDPRIVLLYGDVKQNMDDFEREFPDRIFNVGICEQSTVSMAAGMALEGLRPVVYSLTPFLIERACEQIKMDLGVMQTSVILVGYDYYPAAGPTQTPQNPQVLMAAFPAIRSYFPATSAEAHTALIRAHQSGKPSFVRLVKDHAVK